MRAAQCSLLSICILVFVPGSGFADFPLDSDEQKCASGFLKAGAKIQKAYGLAVAKCVRAITKGSSAETDAIVCAAADLKGQAAEEKLDSRVAMLCTSAPFPIDCPVPCAETDSGGASIAVDDPAELSACLQCLSRAAVLSTDSNFPGAHGPVLSGVFLAQPEEQDLGKCQTSITKAFNKLFQTRIGEGVKCAKAAYKDGATSAPATCGEGSSNAKVVTAEQKLSGAIAKCEIEQASPFNGGECGGLSGSDLGTCLQERARETAQGFIDAGDGATGAGNQDPRCPDRVAVVYRADHGECTLPAHCPLGTCNSFGRCTSETELDYGKSGSFHDSELLTDVSTVYRLLCTSGGATASCGVCEITGIDPVEGDCRCANDNRTICSAPFTSDPLCGGAECKCYADPPVPVSAGGLPGTILRELASDVIGTMNVDTGAMKLEAPVRTRAFIGGSTVVRPAPICGGKCTAGSVGSPCALNSDCGSGGVCGNFDSVPDDGIRNGTCVGGANNGLSCDATARHFTFVAFGSTTSYSLDCFPSAALEVTGAAGVTALAPRTGATQLDAQVPCIGGTCHCGVCAGDQTQACTSDVECGVNAPCQVPSAAGDSQNYCSSLACSDLGGGEGQCATGPDDQMCDGFLRANGEGVFPCLNNTDCQPGTIGVDAGNCTVVTRRRCFPASTVVSGIAHNQRPVTDTIACAPRMVSAGANAALGLPGPMRVRQQLEMFMRCANGPTLYNFSGGCP